MSEHSAEVSKNRLSTINKGANSWRGDTSAVKALLVVADATKLLTAR